MSRRDITKNEDEPGISSRIVSAYALRPIMNLDDDWFILEYSYSSPFLSQSMIIVS